MPQRDKSYLYDILEALNSIRAFITGVDHDSFVENDMLLSAVIRKLEIIGEATKRLSPEFRASHTEVPWKKMAGTKDVLRLLQNAPLGWPATCNASNWPATCRDNGQMIR